MIGLIKVTVFIARGAPQMDKMNPVSKALNHAGQIIIRIYPERTCAKREAIIRAIYRIINIPDILFITYHPWQAKDRKWRIIRMDAHQYIVLFGNRNNLL